MWFIKYVFGKNGIPYEAGPIKKYNHMEFDMNYNNLGHPILKNF